MQKATLRRSGKKMITARITVHIGMQQIVNGMYNSTIIGAETLPASRKAAFSAALYALETRGSDWYPEGDGWDAMQTEITTAAVKLFPELA